MNLIAEPTHNALPKALIMLIDLQHKLLPHIANSQALLENVVKLTRFCEIASLPILVTEQYPEGLGPTVSEIKAQLKTGTPIITKTTFSCLKDSEIAEFIANSNHSNIIVAGIESHICVSQTVCDLRAASHVVHVLADCIGSRSEIDHTIAIQKMRTAGAVITTLEAFMYETLTSSKHPAFKRFMAEIMK